MITCNEFGATWATLLRAEALAWHLMDQEAKEAFQRSIDDGWAELPKTDQSACRAKQSN